MVRNTRVSIMETAKKMFNEHGYNNVSTGDIAATLGISKGNLTYYFKKKEEIIEAIIAESPSTRAAQAPKTLAELNVFFNDIQNTVQENAFYFWHHTQLAQVSPKIQEMQHSAFQKNIEFMSLAFQQLTSDGVLIGENSPNEYECIIDALLISSIYWVPFCRLKGRKTPNSFSQHAWGILSHLLTEKGNAELKKLL